jgi:hypothetical protein
MAVLEDIAADLPLRFLVRETQGGVESGVFMDPVVASAIEQRALLRLFHGRNALTHSPVQVAQILASVSEFGATTPILTDSGG